MLLQFAVGGLRLALPLSDVREVLLIPELICTPGLPAFLQGVINLGGSAVPVVRLAGLLQLSQKELDPYDHVLLLNRGYGLLVERVERVLSREQCESVSVPPSLSFNECVVECLRVDENVVIQLSEEKLLLLGERRRMEEFERLEQARLEMAEEG